jgi:hypothetical protein
MLPPLPTREETLMRLTLAAACLAGAAMLSGPAAAQDTAPVFRLRTAAELARICAADANSTQTPYYDYGFCYGYSAGALDYHRAITPPNSAPLFCAPSPPPSFETMRGRYVSWVSQDPANGGLPVMESIFTFLRTTFPCPPEPPRGRRR